MTVATRPRRDAPVGGLVLATPTEVAESVNADDIAPEWSLESRCGPGYTWQLSDKRWQKILEGNSAKPRARVCAREAAPAEMSAPIGAVGVLPSARADVSCMRGAHPLRTIRVGARSPTGFSIRPRKSSATRRGRALAVSPVAYHGDRQQYGGKDKDFGAEDAPWKKKVKWRLDDEEDEENQRRGVTSLGWTPPPPPTDTGQHLKLRQAQARRG